MFFCDFWQFLVFFFRSFSGKYWSIDARLVSKLSYRGLDTLLIIVCCEQYARENEEALFEANYGCFRKCVETRRSVSMEGGLGLPARYEEITAEMRSLRASRALSLSLSLTRRALYLLSFSRLPMAI